MEFLIGFGLIVLLLLVLGYFAGAYLERQHYKQIRAGESLTQSVRTLTFRSAPAEWRVASGRLVTGSVVVSVDYWKRFLACLRGLIGGPIRAYEPLLDRARREALLRMKGEAMAGEYDAIINVRLETSRLANESRSGIAGVEVLAFGTAVKLERR